MHNSVGVYNDLNSLNLEEYDKTMWLAFDNETLFKDEGNNYHKRKSKI